METEKARNPSQEALSPAQYEKGMSVPEALNRILFRLNHIELTLAQKRATLYAGNIANLEAEVGGALVTVQDLVDTMREAVSLTYVSIQQIRNSFDPLIREIQQIQKEKENDGISEDYSGE
jgi:hypothetical protein